MARQMIRSGCMLIGITVLKGVTAQVPAPVWAVPLGADPDLAYQAIDMVADNIGNTYALGSLSDTSSSDIGVVMKVAPDGTLLWSDSLSGATTYGALELDDALGLFFTIRSDSGYLTGRYDPNGVLQWTNVYSEGSLFTPMDLALGSDGSVHVTGTANGPMNWDIATVKYDSMGVELWAERFNGSTASSADFGRAVAVDAMNNVYVTGANVDTSGTILTISYDPAGNVRWIKRTSPGDQSVGNSVSVTNDQRVIVAGTADDVGTTGDFICVAYDTAGAELWEVIQNVGGDDRQYDLQLAPNGNIYLCGNKNTGGSWYHDIVVMAIDPSGTVPWVRTYDGGCGFDYGLDLATDAMSNLYVTGHGPDSLVACNLVAVTIKYDGSGNANWFAKYYVSGSVSAGGRAVALDASGNVFVFGSYFYFPLLPRGFLMLKYGWDTSVPEPTTTNLHLHYDPTTATLNLSTPEPLNRSTLELFDPLGRRVLCLHLHGQRQVSLAAVAPAVYFARVSGAQGMAGSCRFVKQ